MAAPAHRKACRRTDRDGQVGVGRAGAPLERTRGARARVLRPLPGWVRRLSSPACSLARSAGQDGDSEREAGPLWWGALC